MDMRLYWVKQRQCHVYWGPGYQSLGNYFTKHHAPAYLEKCEKYTFTQMTDR
jgi:hypothetical protein